MICLSWPNNWNKMKILRSAKTGTDCCPWDIIYPCKDILMSVVDLLEFSAVGTAPKLFVMTVDWGRRLPVSKLLFSASKEWGIPTGIDALIFNVAFAFGFLGFSSGSPLGRKLPTITWYKFGGRENEEGYKNKQENLYIMYVLNQHNLPVLVHPRLHFYSQHRFSWY